jgi:hypothetical protein
MVFVSKLTPEQWAEARRLRAEGATYGTIARQFGVSERLIAERARKDRWAGPARRTKAAAGSGAARGSAGQALPAASAAVRSLLARRIYRIVDMKLKILELRVRKQLESAVQGDGDLTLDEQFTSDIASLIKTTEQATELEADVNPNAGGATGGKSADAEARASAAESFRREIAQRIETLIPPS